MIADYPGFDPGRGPTYEIPIVKYEFNLNCNDENCGYGTESDELNFSETILLFNIILKIILNNNY